MKKKSEQWLVMTAFFVILFGVFIFICMIFISERNKIAYTIEPLLAYDNTSRTTSIDTEQLYANASLIRASLYAANTTLIASYATNTTILLTNNTLNWSLLKYDDEPVAWVYATDIPVGNYARRVVACIQLYNYSRYCER